MKSVRIRAMLWAGAGVVFVGIAMYLGTHFELGPKIKLDWAGETRQGTAERVADGGWRLRYSHPNLGIFATSYRGGFGFHLHEGDTFPVTLKVAKNDPKRFQPAGASYPAGIPMGVLFATGMILILYGRRILVSQLRSARKQQYAAKQ